MYHKVKSTLVGLGFVATIMAGGLLFSQPLPAQRTALSPQAQRTEAVLNLAGAVLAMIEAEQAAEHAAERAAEDAASLADTKARSARLKLELGMPFYSFGALRPRRQES